MLHCGCGQIATHLVVVGELDRTVVGRAVCTRHLRGWLGRKAAAVSYPIAQEGELRDRGVMLLADPLPEVVAAGLTAETVPTAIILADITGAALYVNPAWSQLSGQPDAAALGHGWLDYFPPPERYLLDRYFAEGQGASGGNQTITVRAHFSDSEEDSWVSVLGRPLVDTSARPVGWVLSVHDISDVKRLETQLSHRATHDALTGVLNRAATMEFLQRVVARRARTGSPLAVMFIDLDGFKDINDLLGHDSGDQVLVEASRRFGNVLRPSDILGRYGGDEFVAVCSDLDDGAAPGVADRLVHALDEPLHVAATELQISASVGVVTPRDSSPDPVTLISRADRAMYRAKTRGNTFAIDDDPH